MNRIKCGCPQNSPNYTAHRKGCPSFYLSPVENKQDTLAGGRPSNVVVHLVDYINYDGRPVTPYSHTGLRYWTENREHVTCKRCRATFEKPAAKPAKPAKKAKPTKRVVMYWGVRRRPHLPPMAFFRYRSEVDDYLHGDNQDDYIIQPYDIEVPIH